MASLDFAVSIVDRASGPAAKIAKSTDAIDKSLKAADKSTSKVGMLLERTMGPKAAGVIQKFGAFFQKTGKNAEAGGEGVNQAAMAMQLLTGAAAVGAVAAAAVGASLVAIVAVGAHYAAQMASFKEDTLFGMKYAVGSAEGAAETFAYAGRIAQMMGGKQTEVVGTITKFMQRGFSADQAGKMTAAMADVARIPGGNVEALSHAMSMMHGDRALDAKEMKLLVRGLGAGDRGMELFTGNLAKSLGIKGDKAGLKKVKEMMKTGAVKGDAANAALLATINDIGGGKGLGQVAKAFSDTTVTGSIDKIKNNVEALFLAISSSAVGEKIVAIFQRIAAAVDPSTESGKRLLSTLDAIASGVSDMLGTVDLGAMSSAFEFVSVAIGKVGKVITAVMPYFKALGGGVWDGIKAAAGPVAKVLGSIGGVDAGPIQGVVTAFRMIGEVIGVVIVAIAVVAGASAAVAGALGAIPYAMIAGLTLAVAWLVRLGAGMYAIGVNIVQGIGNGISSGVGWLVSIVEGMGTTVISTIRRVLKIGSPSKVFDEVGGYTAEGFARGVNNSTAPQDAVTSMVDPKVASTARGGGGGGARGGVDVGGISISVTVQGNASSDTADKIAAEVANRIGIFFETLAPT